MINPSKLPIALAILSMALAPAGASFSQSPLGREIRVNSVTALNQDSQQVAAGADGGFSVVWQSAKGDSAPFFPYVAARFFDPSGNPLSGELELPQADGQYRGQPFVMARPGGGFRVLTQRATLQEILAFDLEDYSPAGASQGASGSIAPLDERMTITNSVLTPANRLILSWLSTQFELKAARFGARGPLLGSEIPIAAGREPADPLYFGDVEADRNGNAVVTWTGDCGSFDDDAHCDVFAQRLAASGQKVGGAVRVNSFRTGIQEWARVAVAPDGRFLVVWQTREPNNPDRFAIDIAAQLFSPLGVKIGSELRLGPVAGFSELFPEAAADANGDFVVVWSSFRRENGVYGWDIRGQLLRKDGKRIGKEFRINTRQTGNEFSRPKVAFGGNGTFVVVWNARDGDFDGVFARRFAKTR